jgi:hypothetical protein
MDSACGCKKGDRKGDRYLSFDDIDCDGNARLVMAHVDRLTAQPGRNNAFWEYFMKKRAGGSGPKPDDLFLIHSNINQIRELFESCADEAAMTLLVKLEEECC